jgi:hypothetical protein
MRYFKTQHRCQGCQQLFARRSLGLVYSERKPSGFYCRACYDRVIQPGRPAMPVFTSTLQPQPTPEQIVYSAEWYASKGIDTLPNRAG